MELVLATSVFVAPGGSETYILTVARALQRLGHGVTVYANTLGPLADLAAEQGVRIVCVPRELPERCDAALVQDAVVSYQLADRYPKVPQLFRAASELYDFQLPPNLPGVVSNVIALSDRGAERIRAMATEHEIVRLRQPIDTERFKPAGSIRAVPRRALLLGNYLRGELREKLVGALTAHGIECEQIGATASTSLHPERAIWDADIVVGKGRAALEGMACGRAVYVYDEFGADGWVTADGYAAMEADNFAGQATNATFDPNRVREDLESYSTDMGVVNRQLATRNHGARYHANQLCGLLRAAATPSPPPGSPLPELAHLIRLQWQTSGHAAALEEAHGHARTRIEELERYVAELSADHRRLLAITATRRHRLGMSVGRLADRLRGKVGGSH